MARPRLRRAIYDFTEATLMLPQLVALDTSFVVAAIVESETGHEQCRDFLERLAEAGTLLVVSPLLRLEVAESAFRIAVRERHPKGGIARHRRDGRVRGRAGRLMSQTMESWTEALRGFDWVTVAIDEVANDTTAIMHKYGLASFDAAHAATAWRFSVHDFVTLDPDFALLPQKYAALHMVPSQVRHARTLRGGSS